MHVFILGYTNISNKSTVSSFLYLSDGAPEGLLNSLGLHFPVASQVCSTRTNPQFCFRLTELQIGLIGSSTPFITGRPFTLFQGSSIYSDGAVGLAIFNQESQRTSVNFKNVRAVSRPMEVTQYVHFFRCTVPKFAIIHQSTNKPGGNSRSRKPS